MAPLHSIGQWLSSSLLLAACSGFLVSCGGCSPGSSSVKAKAPSPEGEPAREDAGGPAEAPPASAVEGIELANQQAGPGFIAVDDRWVYWTNFEDDRVLKVAKGGAGSPIEIGHNDRGENKGIAVDDQAVYWGGTSLYQQVKSTGEIQRFSFNSILLYNLIPIDGRIYWADGGRTHVQLKSMRSDGTDMRTIGRAETKSFIFATDGSSAFVGSFRLDADDAGQIDITPLEGGASSLFVKTRYLWKIAVDRRFVYWLEGRTEGAIKKKARTGSGDAITLSQGLNLMGPQSMIADDTSLYWTEMGAGEGQGAIGRVSKAGGDAHLIARHQIVPQAIAVDERFVYWVNFGPTHNGTVRKILK